MSKRKPEPELEDYAALLTGAIDRDMPALPHYDPAVEITARDLSNDPARNIAYDKAKRRLDQLVKDEKWTARDVLLANGHKALAYRPKVK